MTKPHHKTALGELIAGRIDSRWDAWAKAHPHLARAIDRTRLIESVTMRLRQDPAFQDALQQAGLDEARLAEAVRAIEIAERVVGRLLRG